MAALYRITGAALGLMLALVSFAAPISAQQPTLKIDVTGGVIEPVPFAIPTFIAENSASTAIANNITRVIAEDLLSTGLFREIPKAAHISGVSNFNAPVQFADWRAINSQALIVGAVNSSGGRLTVKFRLWDVFAQAPMGDGVQLSGSPENWRRISHKVADAVYSRLTGETGYFDSKIVFVSESGPKNDRRKRLAIMDYDGAGLAYLTNDENIVLAPRFSPNNRDILYTSYETGIPRVYLMNVDTLQRRVFANLPGMGFAPRFAPDGNKIVLSISERGNTDIYTVDLASGQRTRLTSGPSINTAPSFSPDGKQIVFESDRGGSQQLYIMSVNGGDAKRISFGNGRYATPVWSPRGDLVAFTKIVGGRFHIGVMRLDGTQERLLTASFIDEAPTWSPNGRVLMFFRVTSGANGAPQVYSVDITGRNMHQVPTPSFASDPAWSGLLK
ncbi:MAG: Tol-Pal system protein TolB [Rhodobacteraceae bacterium]|nr:Tol-Pal system protein TolB [Paracoccaceae bacterium]